MRRVEAPRRECNHRQNLLMRQMETVHDFVYRGPNFQIVKDNRNGRARVPEYPFAVLTIHLNFRTGGGGAG